MSNDDSDSTPSTSTKYAGSDKESQSLPDTQASTSLTSSGDQHASNRHELLQRARAFLQSSQIVHEEDVAKRRFLIEKGLNEQEINFLLQEKPNTDVSPTLLVPPRTYPQPPPSNLPNLLLGLARILSWIAGGSAALILIYFRYVYPRLTKSFEARISIREHQRDLLQKLNTSLSALKEEQTRAFCDLPRSEPYREGPAWADCHTVKALQAACEKLQDKQRPPPLSVLRCVIEDMTAKGESVTTQALFGTIESSFSVSAHEDDYANELWDTLHTAAIFKQEEKGGATVWSYAKPEGSPSSPVLDSLSSLRSTLPPPRLPHNRFQHTLQMLSDFTGYITTQTYSISTLRLPGMGISAPLSPEEEEVRREIRALKGLVLNRYVSM
ncbi:hypothetical protein K474DRAFT_500649 [Panus rudis PR-1116 ss-1]|nr:hypothetical protein K474DRAFT_500649 [Panus rudis PR-1116 ss-1]